MVRNLTKLIGTIAVVKGVTKMQDIDVRSVRRERGLTQKAFADTFGFTIGAVRTGSREGSGRIAPRGSFLRSFDRRLIP